MLSASEISNRIQNPDLVVPNDLDALKDLTQKYPYTQLFSILYLKALSKSGDVRFEEELKQHSYRISDRVQLYQLIQEAETQSGVESGEIEEIRDKQEGESTERLVQNDELEVETQTPELIAHNETIENEELDIENSSAQEPATQNQTETEETEEDAPIFEFETTEKEVEAEDTHMMSVEEEFVEEELKTESDDENLEFPSELPSAVRIENSDDERSNDQDQEANDQTEPQDKLDESILHHALATNYQLDDLTPEEETALEERTIEEEETEENQPEVEIQPLESPTSFTGWLHSNNNYTKRDSSDKEAIKAVVEDFVDFDPSSELFGEVEKPKTEFFSPTKKAKKSLEESELPVSETLAKIYIMQGNYPQAIAAYKQLSLAFPEKTVFFANLIEDLEKKINT